MEPSPATADDLPDIAKDEVQVEAEPTPLDTNRSVDEAANDIPVTIDDSPKPVGDPVEEVVEFKETEGASIDQPNNAQVEGAEPVAVVGTTTGELHEETTTETHESPASIKDDSATRADSEAAVADSNNHVLEADEAKTFEAGHIAGGPTPEKLDITAATIDEAQQGYLATEEPHLGPSTPQSIDQVEFVIELASTEVLLEDSKFTAADSELVDEAVKYPPTVGNAVTIAGKSEGGNVVEVKNGAGQEEAADTVSKEEPAVAPVVQSPVVTDDIPVAAPEAPAPEGQLHEIQEASDNNSSKELTVTIEATHEVPEVPPSFTTDEKSTVVEDLVVDSEEFPVILGVATTVTDAQSEADPAQEEAIAGGENTQVASGETVVEEPPSTTLDEDVSGVAEETATQARSEDELMTENAADEDSSHRLVLVEEKTQEHALEVDANAMRGGEDNERASIDDVINDTTHASKTVAVTGPDGAAIDSPPAPMPKDAAIPGTPRILIASATPSIKPINLGPDNEAISLGLVPVENIPLPPPSSSSTLR